MNKRNHTAISLLFIFSIRLTALALLTLLLGFTYTPVFIAIHAITGILCYTKVLLHRSKN